VDIAYRQEHRELAIRQSIPRVSIASRRWRLVLICYSYWAQDIYSLNSNFGTAADLKALSTALHARGMVSALCEVLAAHANLKSVSHGRCGRQPCGL
jgi:hypothetical protein